MGTNVRTLLLPPLALLLLLAPAPPASGEATTFAFAPSGTAETVTLAGSFNGWSASATPMARDSAEARFAVTLDLPHGLHPYKFVVDGRDWRPDPAAERFEPDGVGGTNSVRLVGPDFAALARRAAPGDGKICAEALLFDPATSEGASPADGGLRVQLRVLAGDVERVRHRAEDPHAGARTLDLVRLPADPPFEWFRGELPAGASAGTFEVEDGASRLELPAPAPPPEAPARFDAPRALAGRLLYHVLIDRFDNGDPANDPPWVKPWDAEPDVMTHLGGDLAGLRRRLPHLAALGAEALLLSPLFESRAAHGYEPEDYGRICARLGGETAFAALEADLAAAGIPFAVDLVLNHTGTGHPAFRDLVERGTASPHRDWYFPSSFPVDPAKGNYRGWRGHGNLPELNTDHPDVRAMLLSACSAWAGRAAAFRLDAADDIEPGFWRAFRRRMRERNPDLLLLGELWGDAAPWLAGDQFDAATNYPFRRATIDWLNGDLADAPFRRRLAEPFRRHPDAVAHLLVNMTGSHDTKRIATELVGGSRAVELYAALLFAWPGIPCIYYGDEIGMEGGEDPANRRGMRWSPDPAASPLFRHFQALATLRRARPSLSRGALLDLRAEGGLLSFERRHGAERTRLYLNRTDSPATLPLPAGTPPPRDLISGAELLPDASGGFPLPPRACALLDGAALPAPATPDLAPELD